MRISLLMSPFVWACITGLAVTAPAADPFHFARLEMDHHVGNVCYAVVPADVNNDGLKDVVVVTENRVLWYDVLSGEKRVIIEDQTIADNVCIAPYDIDGDGNIDFALGAGWPANGGTIQWLSRGASLDEPWKVHMIGKEPWVHRMRFADVLGTGKPQLVVSPLNKTEGEGVRLLAFSIPDDPKTERWPETVLDHSLNRLHNHWHVDFDGDGTIDTLTASEEGIHVIQRTPTGWSKTRLGTGMPADDPKDRGAGEVKLGRLGDGRQFIATIEPMHGTSVVVYTPPAEGNGLWDRHVIDDTLMQGHALWAADLDNDGDDELVVGHREAGTGSVKGPGVYAFILQDATGTNWEKQVIDDGGVAVEDLFCFDLGGDGLPEIFAGGRATHNLQIYLNIGQVP